MTREQTHSDTSHTSHLEEGKGSERGRKGTSEEKTQRHTSHMDKGKGSERKRRGTRKERVNDGKDE